MTPQPAKFISEPEAAESVRAAAAPPPPPVLEPPAEQSGPLVPVPVDMRNAAITVMAVIAAVLVLQYAQSVFVPLVLGLLISYALDPLVTFLEKHRVPRAASAGLLLLTLVGGGGFGLYQLRTQAQQIIQQLPDGARRLRQQLEQQKGSTTTAIEQMQKAAAELEKAADGNGAPPTRPGVTARPGRGAADQHQRLRHVGLDRASPRGRASAC